MITTDHEKIKEWIKNYNGQPEIIDEKSAGSDHIGLRINFPGKSDERYLSDKNTNKKIEWKTFFDVFEKEKLAFESIDEDIDVNPSVKYKFVKRTEIT